MKILIDFSEARFRDSDGRERTRGGVNYFQAEVRRWRVYDLEGGYAIHERIEHLASSKPRKDFRWRHPDGRLSRNGEISGLDRLYGLELVNGQRRGLLVEGEKCADAARAVLPESWLIVATVCGASTIPDADVLDRLAVIPHWHVWADNDANGKGQEHMARIAAYMARRCDVRTVRWPEAPPGGDVADFLAINGRRELMALLRDAVPFK